MYLCTVTSVRYTILLVSLVILESHDIGYASKVVPDTNFHRPLLRIMEHLHAKFHQSILTPIIGCNSPHRSPLEVSSEVSIDTLAVNYHQVIDEILQVAAFLFTKISRFLCNPWYSFGGKTSINLFWQFNIHGLIEISSEIIRLAFIHL